MADDLFVKAIEAMTDVQRRSAEAAGKLVERLVATVDGHPVADNATDETRFDTDDAVAGMAKLWRDSITSLASAVTGSPGASAPRIDVNAPAPPATVRIVLDPSFCGSAEVWVHNPTAAALDKLRVHCAAPVAHDGSVLDAAITVDPDAFGLPARSSRGVELTVDAPDAQPGSYRTLLLVDGLPDQWLPLEIAVPEPTE